MATKILRFHSKNVSQPYFLRVQNTRTKSAKSEVPRKDRHPMTNFFVSPRLISKRIELESWGWSQIKGKLSERIYN